MNRRDIIFTTIILFWGGFWLFGASVFNEWTPNELIATFGLTLLIMVASLVILTVLSVFIKPFGKWGDKKIINKRKSHTDVGNAVGTVRGSLGLMLHTLIAEGCDWLALCTDLSHEQIEEFRNTMLTVKDEQLSQVSKTPVADNSSSKFKVGDTIQFKGLGNKRYTIKNVCGTTHYISTQGERMDMSYTNNNFEKIG